MTPPKEIKLKKGRPSKYKEEFVEQAYKLCLLGATDAEMANFFEVSEQTLNEWKKQHSDFLESLKRGKNLADAKIAQSLYFRAKGYKCKATKFAIFQGKITDTKEYVEHYPPDPVACIFWLKNRQPDKWREKQDPKQEGDSFTNNFEEALTSATKEVWKENEK